MTPAEMTNTRSARDIDDFVFFVLLIARGNLIDMGQEQQILFFSFSYASEK